MHPPLCVLRAHAGDKDRRRCRVNIFFGFLLHGMPCFEACRCGTPNAPSPISILLPHRTTPELRHLQAKLGTLPLERGGTPHPLASGFSEI
jgi:hypothetical protein